MLQKAFQIVNSYTIQHKLENICVHTSSKNPIHNNTLALGKLLSARRERLMETQKSRIFHRSLKCGKMTLYNLYISTFVVEREPFKALLA